MTLKRVDITKAPKINSEKRGYLDKEWIYIDQKYLVKYNDEIVYKDQDIMEYFSAEFFKLCKFKTVDVTLIENKDNGKGCMVKNFLKEDEVLLETDSHANFVYNGSAEMKISKSFSYVNSIFSNLLNSTDKEITKLKDDYIKTIFCDCLAYNPDRKLRNVGVIYNEQTKESKLSPLFDNGLSFHDYTSGLEPVIAVANTHYDRCDVLSFLLKHHYKLVQPILSNYIQNVDVIKDKLKNIQNYIDIDKYIYISDCIDQTYNLLYKYQKENDKDYVTSR